MHCSWHERATYLSYDDLGFDIASSPSSKQATECGVNGLHLLRGGGDLYKRADVINCVNLTGVFVAR